MTLAQRLTAARIEAMLTRAQLAKAVGYSRMSVWRYEKGERTPNIAYVKAVAKATKVKFAKLAG